MKDLKEKYLIINSISLIKGMTDMYPYLHKDLRRKAINIFERIGKKANSFQDYSMEIRDYASLFRGNNDALNKLTNLNIDLSKFSIDTLESFIENNSELSNSMKSVTQNYLRSYFHHLTEISVKTKDLELTSFDKVVDSCINLIKNIFSQARSLKEVSPIFNNVSIEYIASSKAILDKILSLDLHKSIKNEERNNIIKSLKECYNLEVSFQKDMTSILNSLLNDFKKDENQGFVNNNSRSIELFEEYLIKKKEIDKSLSHLFNTMILDEETEIKKFEESIFPIRIGDNDDVRFDGRPIIKTIQKALMGFDSNMAKRIQKGGGDNGRYNIFTAIVISSIKKQSGDKDFKNPDLTKQVFDMLIESGVFTRNQLEFIKKEISNPVEDSSYVSEAIELANSTVLSFDSFSMMYTSINNPILEKFKINREALEADMDEISKEMQDSSEMKIDRDDIITSKLSKLLRKIGIISEGDDFMDQKGNYRKGYNKTFLEAWIQALDELGADIRFFSYDGGIYFGKSKNSSLATPLNFYKFLKDVESQDDLQSRTDVVYNLSNCFSVYGGFPSRKGSNGIKDVEDLKSFVYNGNAIPQLKGSKILSNFNGEKGYLSNEEGIKLKTLLKDFITCPDLDYQEFSAINNILIFSSNLVITQDGRYMPFSDFTLELLKPDIIKKLRDDKMLIEDSSIVFYVDENDRTNFIKRKSNATKSFLRDNIDKTIKRIEHSSDSMKSFCKILNSKDGRDTNSLDGLYKIFQVKIEELSF